MDDPRKPGFESEELDLNAVLWVRGVDYVGGWREARRAETELIEVLTVAGIELTEVQSSADTAADGTGVVRLRMTTRTARELAAVVRGAAA